MTPEWVRWYRGKLASMILEAEGELATIEYDLKLAYEARAEKAGYIKALKEIANGDPSETRTEADE